MVSDVDLTVYGEEGLRANLENLRWLETVARTHDAVVREAASTGPVAPFRLATVFFDDQSMRAHLDECLDALRRALDRVDGRMEWSVKVIVPEDEGKGEGESAAAAPTGTPAPGSGAEYLMRKRVAQQRRAEAADAAAGAADAVHRALSAEAVASRRLNPQDPRLSGHKGSMVLNAAYLVDDAAADAFMRSVTHVRRHQPNAQIDVQGPWPPYSFATLDDV
jgi:hypothetical protein